MSGNYKSSINYDNWDEKLHHHNSIDSYIKDSLENGIHSLHLTDLPLDILMKNSEEIKNNEYIVVSFSGDVSRGSKKAPFFSFSGIISQLNKPLISFSDPSLSMDQRLSLTWYAGNDFYPDLPDLLANICDKLVEHTGKKLLIVGGSGGGFASLNIQSRMKNSDKTVVFAWNPQTNILEFSRNPVAKYISYAFAESHVNFVKDTNDEALKEFVSSKIEPILKFNGKNKVFIMMDGYDAPHLRKHLKPYINQSSSNLIVNDNIIQVDNLTICVGDWGEGRIGHQPLPRDQVAPILNEIMSNKFEPLNYEFFKNNRQLLNLKKHDISDLQVNFSIISNQLLMEFCISDYFMGYQIRNIIKREKSGHIVYKSSFINYTSKAKTFIKLDEKLEQSKLNNFIFNIEVYDFFGNTFVLSKKVNNFNLRKYGVNSIWG